MDFPEHIRYIIIMDVLKHLNLKKEKFTDLGILSFGRLKSIVKYKDNQKPRENIWHNSNPNDG